MATSDRSWAGGVNEAVSSWILLEVLPVLAAVILICVIIAGVITQIFIIVALKRAEKLNQPIYRLILHASIQDIVALFVVVSPNFITACIGEWPFKEGLCVLQGVLVTALYIMTFTSCVWIMFERCFKFTQPEWWKTIFENNNGRIYLVVFVIQWILSVIYSVLPLSGVSQIEYQKDGLQCDRTHSDSAWLMNLHFIVTYGIPLLIGMALSMILFAQRFKARRKEEDIEKLVSVSRRNSEHYSTSSPRGFVFSTVQEDQLPAHDPTNRYSGSSVHNSSMDSDMYEHENSAQESPITSAESSNNISTSPGKQTRTTVVKRGKSIWDINRQIEDHRLASTLMLTCVLIFVFWLPYVILAYFYTYSHSALGQWRGFYVLAMIFASAAYILRPVTYLIHNKAIRADVRRLFPQKVMNKYHHYNDKRKEKISAIKEKLSLPQIPKAHTNGIAPAHNRPQKKIKTFKGQTEKVSKGNLPSTPIEELEMSQFREAHDSDPDLEDMDDEDPWMSVIEQGSIPGQH